MPNNKHDFVITICLIICAVLLWRLALMGVSILADRVLTYDPSFPYAENILSTFDLPRYIYSWANFDGVHYLTIVKHGYVGTGLIQAFFPVYPGVIWLGVIFTSYHQAINLGLLLSFIFLCLGSVIWWWAAPYFLRSWPTDVTRFRWVSLCLLLLFPTAFFCAGLYTESLFLLLSVSCLYLGITRHFVLASILAGLASGTKVIGIFLVPALLVELWWLYWQNRFARRSKMPRVASHPELTCVARHPELDSGSQSSTSESSTSGSHLNFAFVFLQSALIILIGSLGLLLYAGYLQRTFHDPLYFLHVQSEFGAGRQESLVLYPQTAWRAFKILLTARPIDLKYLAYTQEFLVGTLGMIGIVLTIKIVRPSVWIFSLLVFLLPTLTGSFSSMPRYVLACYALFLGLAYILYLRKIPLILFLLLSTILLIFNTMLFIQGYWVA